MIRKIYQIITCISVVSLKIYFNYRTIDVLMLRHPQHLTIKLEATPV